MACAGNASTAVRASDWNRRTAPAPGPASDDAETLRQIADRIPYTLDVTTLYEIAARIEHHPTRSNADSSVPASKPK